MTGWSAPRRIGRPGVVTSTASDRRRASSSAPRRSVAAIRQGGLDRAADDVGDGADPRPILRRQRADPAQDGREAALLAEDVQLDRLERRHVGGARDRGERLVAQRLEIAGQLGQLHVSLVRRNQKPSTIVTAEGSMGCLIRRPSRPRRSS